MPPNAESSSELIAKPKPNAEKDDEGNDKRQTLYEFLETFPPNGASNDELIAQLKTKIQEHFERSANGSDACESLAAILGLSPPNSMFNTEPKTNSQKYDLENDEYQTLALEVDKLREELTMINRLLDDPDNDASQREIQEDIKASLERSIAEKKGLMSWKLQLMRYWRSLGG